MDESSFYGRQYDKCAYKGCGNGRYKTRMKLFRFPVPTDARFDVWIANSGNTELRELSVNTIHRRGLCAVHFSDESFKDESKSRLKRNSIPLPYSDTSLDAEPNCSLEHQSPSSMKAYAGGNLDFDAVDHDLEWIDIEPHANSGSNDLSDPQNSAHEEQVKRLEASVESLKHENKCMRRLIRSLKFRLKTQINAKKNLKRLKTQRLDVIPEQQTLKPAAKAFIRS